MSSYDPKIRALGCPTPMPKTKQVQGPTSAPRHLLAPGTPPPLATKMSSPVNSRKELKYMTPTPKFAQRQGGRSGGNEPSS